MQGYEQHAACRVAQQLAETAGLSTASKGDVTALPDLVQQAVAAVTATQQTTDCQLPLKDRLATCQLLDQLLRLPVAVPTMQQPPQQQPGSATNTQALFQQVLGQLPGVVLQLHQQANANSSGSSSSSSSLVQLIHQQQPGACPHLEALLHAASEQLKAAVQEPAVAKWPDGLAWQHGQQLLQLSVTTMQQAVQQQLRLTGSMQGNKVKLLLSELVGALSTALAAAEAADGVGAAGVAAVMSAAEQVFQLLQHAHQVSLLSEQSCKHVRKQLLQLVLPASVLKGSTWRDMPCPEVAIQPAAGQTVPALQQCHPQRLQVLALLLQQDSTNWTELASMIAADSDASSGWDQLLQLVLLVLQAVSALPKAATDTAAADSATAAAAQAAAQAAEESESEADYFHDIFGSDGADDEGTAAAAADSTKAAVMYEHALAQLAKQLLGGLAVHLLEVSASGGSSSSSGGDGGSSSGTCSPGSWGLGEQGLLQLALCFVALSLPHGEQDHKDQHQQQQQQQQQQQDKEQEQQGQAKEEQQYAQQLAVLSSLAPVQQHMKAAVQQLCISHADAAQQLQQAVLLAPLAAGSARSRPLMQIVAHVMVQHAAAAAAVSADASMTTLLHAPWVHLSTQLACITEAAASSDSDAQLQQQLAWLLCPARLSIMLAMALGAPAGDRAVQAAIMLHCLDRCSLVLAAVKATAAQAAAAATGQDAHVADATSSGPGAVGAHAVALCAVHACLSALLWLLLPPALLPIAWLQQHLQSLLQANCAEVKSSSPAAAEGGVGTAVQVQGPWPVGLTWVAAMMQYKHETDELPVLLESLGVPADAFNQEALSSLLPAFVPSCLPGMAAADNAAAMQEAVQHMQQPAVLAAAFDVLQGGPGQHAPPGVFSGSDSSSSGVWRSLGSEAEAGAGSNAAQQVLQQLLDSVLPTATAAWASGTEHNNSDVAAAVAYSCCHERALQLLLVLQQPQQGQQQQQGCTAAATATGFNMFGSYQHLVHLQRQLAHLLADYEAALHENDSSSQLVPCQLSLQPSALSEHPAGSIATEHQPAVAAVAEQLSSVLAGALSDAVQRFQLCGTEVSTPLLLKQQLHSCCAEVELLGQTMQAARVVLVPHLPKLLPLLSQLQWQVTNMQLRCLAAALSTCYNVPNSSSTDDSTSSSSPSIASRAAEAQSLQLLLMLCTDADYAADAVDAVHEGLGYCLLASLSEPQGQCWPSRADPAAAVAAAATSAAEQEACTSRVESAASQCVAGLMQPYAPAEQQAADQQMDWPLLAQELNLLHGCFPAVPLPNFWAVGSLNRASGSIAAAGACLVACAAAAAAAAAADGQESSTDQQGSQEPAQRQDSASAVTAAVAEWMHDMGQLELQVPLFLRPLQLQHAHLLQEAVKWVASCKHSDSSRSTAPTAAARSTAEPRGVASVLRDVSAALGAAVTEAAAADDADSLGRASAMAAAAVGRLRDIAEDAGSYHVPAMQDSSAGNVAAQLVQGLLEAANQDGQHGKQQAGIVLQLLWQCVAMEILATSRVVELIQQVTGTFRGSDDVHAQQLHDSFLQQLRESLLQLPQQYFNHLLLRQLSTKDAFASGASGVCRELWQLLLAAEGEGSSSAVRLLERLASAVLQLTLGTQQAAAAKLVEDGAGTDSKDSKGGKSSSSGNLSKKQLAAVSTLLGVVIQCATALGLPGMLACLNSLQALGAAAADWSSRPSCSSVKRHKSGTEASSRDTLTERLIPFLPLLLFVQRVISQTSATANSSSSASGRTRTVRKSDSAISRSSRESGLGGAQNQASETADQPSSRSSSSAGDAQNTSAQPQQEQSGSSSGPAGGSDASTVSVPGPFEAAAASLVLQDDAVQVLGGGTAAVPYDDEDDFLDEFEDEEEYLTQLLQHGALAAGASSGQPAGGSSAPAAAGAAVAAGNGDGEGDESTSDEDESSSEGDDDYHDAQEGLPCAEASSDADPLAATGSSAAAATGAGAAAPAAAAAEAASATAAAAAAAFGAALQAQPLGDAVDDDEQALLDEEFAALLQELLSAGAAPDVALAAVTAATGMAPPAAAVAVATEAAAASGDDEMVAVVEQLAAGAAAAAAAAAAGAGADGAQHAGTAATSPSASPSAPRQAGTSGGREQEGAGAGASGASSSSRRKRHRRSSSDSSSSYLPQLRRYWQRTRRDAAGSAPLAAATSSNGTDTLQCTFAVHGDQFVEQHWFQCYTCGLTDSRGCCSACVRICHAGHDVVYAAKSRFFCDCGGENGPREDAVACKCLSAVPVGSSAAGAAAQGSSTGSGSSSSALMQQGWLLAPSANPLARAGLAATLPDPLDAAWAFDPELYPDLYAAATGANSSSTRSSKTGADSGGKSGKPQAPAGALEQLLYCGAAARATEQQAAVLKLIPQGLVAKAARTLQPWLVAGAPSGDAAAAAACGVTDSAAASQQQQHLRPQEVLQGVVSSALQLSQLMVGLLLQHSSMDRGAGGTAPAADVSKAGAAEPASQATVVPPADVLPGVLPAVLQTKQLIMEGSSSSTRVLTKPAAGSDGTPGDGSTGNSDAQQQQQPLVELQRVIRLGTMNSSSSRTRTRSSGEYGTDSSSSSRGPEVPAEVAAALEGGLVCQQSAAAARQGQLLAVCRGESVGLMDGRLLAAELCGRDIFTKEEISAAVAVTSKALSPNQASNSSTANDASSSGGGAGASSYFYVRRHAAKFHVLALHWDLLQGRRLLVVGYEQAQVWSVEPRDLTISDRLVLQLPALTAADEAGRVVSAAAWLPDSDTWVAVTTPLRVYLFDLTHSASQPAVVIEPEGHVLLSGAAAFVPRLVAQLQQPQQQQGGKDTVHSQLQQRLYVLLLTRDGQLLSAELPQQLLDRTQSCAAHWPHASCLAATHTSSGSRSGAGAQPVSRSSSPGPAATAPGSRPSSRGGERGRGTGEGADSSSSSSSAYGCVRLVAQTVTWPNAFPHLQTGRSCHWLQANSLLAVAGTGRPAAAAAAAAGSADSSSSSAEQGQEQEQQQLLLQLDATCSNVLQCCRWDTAEAAAAIMGSPKPLVLSPAAVYWDLPLLPAARASYGAAQLFAVAPGQAKQLLNGTGSSTSNGQGCAYIAGLLPEGLTSSSSSSSEGSNGVWQAVVQPLHLRHSSAGAVVDGLAVLSFPYTQQLLLVVLCSKGNMYMYATKRPPGLRPMQPYTQLLRQQLTQGSSQQQQQGVTGSAEAVQQEAPARPAAAAVGDGQHGFSRRAAAVAVATGALLQPAAAAATAAQSGSGSSQQAIIPADASILLLQHCQSMTSQLSVSGDISRAGTAEAAARALFKTPTDPDRRVEGPTPGAGMKLVIKFASGGDLQPVGMKLLLPAAGAAPGSVKLTFGDSARSSGVGAGADASSGGRPNSIAAIAAAARSAARAAAGAASSSNARTVQLAAAAATGSSSGGSARSSGRHQRWHQIILTPDESAAAAAAGQITYEFSAAVDTDRRVALCHMDLFGQPAEVVADRAKQQHKQQEEEQVLSVDTCCTAAAAAVPAVLMSGAVANPDGNAAASSQLLLNALLQTGAAAASAAAAAEPAADSDTTATDRPTAAGSSSGQWQQQVLPVVRQLLCLDAGAATVWSPSWQCEAAARVLLETAVQSGDTIDPAAGAAEDASGVGSAGSCGISTAASAVQDGWKLSQAAAVLQEFACTCTAAYGSTAAAAAHRMQPSDAAVFGYVHALAQLQSVLQVRPDAVVDYLRQQSSSSSSSSNVGLAAAASSGLAAAVFTLKQLSGTALLPAELLAPMAKTAVELWMACAAAAAAAPAAAERQQQQQRQQQRRASSAQLEGADVQEAMTSAAQGIVGLLLSSDPQLRLHTAAAWVQACSSSSSSSSSSNASSRCAVFAAAACLLLEQREYPCSQMLAAYQAIADIATNHLHLAAAAAEDSAQAVQSVGQVVQVAVQQLSALHLGGASVIAGEHSMSPDAAEMILLLQLLLAHVLSTAWQQQQQQSHADSSSSGSGTAKQPAKLHKQLLPQAVLQQLTTTLLARLQYLVLLLQRQQFGESPSGTAVQSGGVYFTVLPGEGAKQAGPGGYSNYQALLSPPPVVNTWGVSSSLCQSLIGGTAAAAAAGAVSNGSSSSSSSEGTMGLGGWLLDPYLQGGKTGTRLLQGLPLQLTAAAVDLAHTLLHYGLVQAVGRVTSAQRQQVAQQAIPAAAAAAATGSAWCSVLCDIMDMGCLYPVRRLAKQVVVDVCGSAAVYKEVRSLHLLSKRTAALLQALGLPPQQQQQQQQQGPDPGVQGAGVGTPMGDLGAAVAAVSALQGSWQQQCAAIASLAQLLSVAESQPVGWAHICSSSSAPGGAGAAAGGSTVLPLLVQLVLECKVPQISLPAVKLINAALTGVVKASSSSSSKSKSSSSKGQSGSGSKAPAVSIPVLNLAWLLPQQQQQQQKGASTAAAGTAAAAGPAPLSFFVDKCVVGWPESKERKEAAKTLVLLYRALGASGDRTAQNVLLQAVLQAVPSAGPLAGAASLQLYSAANQLLKLTGEAAEQDAAAAAGDQGLSQVVSSTAADLFATATAAAAALTVHPCGLAYQQLQDLMELQQPGSSSSSSSTAVGYWLELSGCDVAGGRLARKPSSTPVRLDSIAAELKYGDRQVLARLAGWYSVHKLLLVVHSPRKSKTVSDLRIWYCDSPISDLQQLKQQGLPALPSAADTAAGAAAGAVGGQQPVWRLAAADVSLSPGQTEVTVAFELPLVLSCLMVEFSGFHVSVNDLAAEVLHCPRCSHVVTDKHGLCGYCRENAYQCRQCRHINYEAPDAFICSECGHSRYGRFELLLQTVKAPGCPPLLAQANTDEALSLLDTAAATAANKATSLQSAAAAVQQQAAALATAGFHHVPDAAAGAAAGSGSSNKRGSSGGGSSSSSTESLMRPGLRHLAELYTERCRSAFEEALQAARAHAAVRSAIAEAEATASSSSADTVGHALSSSSSTYSILTTALATAAGDADAAAALFSSCSYGHISAILCASVNLLRGALAVAPAAVTAAAQQYSVLPGLLALLQPPGSTYSGTSGGSTSAQAGSSSSSFVADVRSLLLALSRADATLHDQLLQLLQQQLLPQGATAAVSSGGTKGLSGHQLQLLLMIAQHDVQHMPKQPPPTAAAATVAQQARSLRLVLQLLQQAVAGRCTQGLWPDLLLLPGLKVMTAAAAVQQQWAKAAAAQAAQDAAEAAAAASAAAEADAAATAAAAAAAAEAAKTEPLAAAVATGVEVSGESSPAAAATAADQDFDVLDATVLSDAEAEAREQLKIAEYFSRKGSGSSGLPRSGHSGPPYMQQQQQRLQQRQRLQPMYGQSPFVPPPQQQPLQYAGSGDVRPVARSTGAKPAATTAAAAVTQQQQQKGPGDDIDRATAKQREQQEAARKAQAAAAVAAEKAAASAAAAADLPEVVLVQQLVLLAQQLLLHHHSIAVRKESAALLLQLQPDAVQRLRQLQLLVPDACSALAGSTPGAAAVPGTELFALLMETVAELLVLNSKGRGGSSSTDSSGSRTGTHSAPQQQQSAAAADSAGVAHVSDADCRTVLSGLLHMVSEQLVQQVSALLQQEQQLCPGQRSAAAAAAPARTAALPMLLEQLEQLLIGLAQLQLHHPPHAHPLSPRHRSHHTQQQQGGQAGGWVDSVCLQQLLWALGGLDALTAGRTGATQSAAQQLHRLVKQGWLQGGDSTAAAAGSGTGDGTFGESDILDEDEDYTEADEYETEVTNEEGMITNEEGESSEYADGDAAAAAGQSQLLSSLPALSADVLAQRQAQLVEAIVTVLAAELQRFDHQQQQKQTVLSAPLQAAATAVPGPSTGGILSWRSSLAVVGSLIALLTSAISPEKPPPTYQLLLEKAATQEEFIPGQLPSGGLVTSAALTAAAAAAGTGGGGEGVGGPLMRDVKNYICRRLDMTGLIDDDFGMELLIGGSLISLSLPVLDVIQHHWWPLYQQQGRHSARSAAAASSGGGSGGGSMPPPNVPMQVTFRLSGLDGEATEPQVKDLNPGQAAGQNPDEDNVLAGVLARGQGTGLGLLLQLLLIAHQQPVRALRRVSGQLLQLLKAAVGQGECRQQLLQQGALGCLLHLVHLACKPLLASSSGSSSSSSSSSSRKVSGADRTPAAATAAVCALGCGITGAQLLLLLECLQELVTEANRLGQPFHLGAIGTPESAPTAAPQQQQQQAALAETEALAAAAASSSSSSALAAQRVSSSSTEVAQLADGLSVLEAVGLGSCAAVLAKLLTALAHHSSTAQLGLIKHFAPALDLTALDNAAAAAGDGSTSAAAAAGAGGAGGTQGELLQPSAAAAAAAAAAVSTAGSGAEGDGDDESPLLAAVHSESSGGPMSVQEHCLQLKAFLRLIEALSNTAATSSSSGSAGSVAQQQQQQQQQQQLGGGSTADFKQLVLEQGVPARLASYLQAAFTPAGPSSSASSAAAVGGASPSGLLQPGSAAWAAAAARPGVPFALQLLTALANGHAATAAALAAQHPSLLQLLHLLEGTAGGSTITPLAEACLEALSGAGAAGVASSISALRAATAAEMKARAAKKREALLASMGMVQIEAAAEAGGGIKILPSPGGVPALSPLAAELAALEGSAEDDEGNVCMVCREGYALQPTTLLGCYCFCRVAAAAEWPGCSPPWGTPHDLLLSTVSHFNLIHVNCHAAAKAADASLRQPKREWQGATLRNGNVLCNSLLPLAAPAGGKAETAYAAAVMAFWQQQLSAPSSKEAAAAAGSGGGSGGGSDAAAVNVSVSLSRRSAALRDADNSLLRVSLVAADLAMLLWRFSAQLSFSEEARGGGRASNARLLFALLQLGRYYVVEAPTSELKQAQKLLTSAAGAGAALGLEAAAPAAGTAGAAGATGSGSGSGSGAASGTSSGSGSTAGSCSDSDMAELVRHAPFALALSLLCMGPTEWMAARRSMLALASRAGVSRAVQQAAAADTSGSGSSSHRRSSSGASPSAAAAPAAAGGVSGMSDEALYEAAAPMLRLFGFVDWLHQWAKPAVGLAPAASSGSSTGSGSSGWGGAMAQQLQDLKGCAEAAGELLEVIDEAEGAFGLQDLLDGLGLLGVVLGPKSSSCEEFLRQAVAGL